MNHVIHSSFRWFLRLLVVALLGTMAYFTYRSAKYMFLRTDFRNAYAIFLSVLILLLNAVIPSILGIRSSAVLYGIAHQEKRMWISVFLRAVPFGVLVSTWVTLFHMKMFMFQTRLLISEVISDQFLISVLYTCVSPILFSILFFIVAFHLWGCTVIRKKHFLRFSNLLFNPDHIKDEKSGDIH